MRSFVFGISLIWGQLKQSLDSGDEVVRIVEEIDGIYLRDT